MLHANNLQLQSIFGATFVRKTHLCVEQQSWVCGLFCVDSCVALDGMSKVWRKKTYWQFNDVFHKSANKTKSSGWRMGSYTTALRDQHEEQVPCCCVVPPHADVMTLMSSEFNKWHQVEDLVTFSNLWQNVGEINKPGLRLIAKKHRYNQVN